MKKNKIFIIILLISAIFLFASCKKETRFPNNLNEIVFQSVYDSVILNKYKVNDKDLINKFSNMLNKCKFILLTDEEKEKSTNPYINGARIVMEDSVFYLNEEGLYSNAKKLEDIFTLEGFDKGLFNEVFESRKKCLLSNIEAEFPKGLDKLYCREVKDSYESIVTDKIIVDDFLKMLQGCKIRVLREEEIQQVNDFTINIINDYIFSTGLMHEDALMFEINEDGYLHEYDSLSPEDIYYLEGFDKEIFNRFISAKSGVIYE